MIRIIRRKRESRANLTHSCHRGMVVRWAEAKEQAVAAWPDPAEDDCAFLLLWWNKR